MAEPLNNDQFVRLECLSRAIHHASITDAAIDAVTLVENAGKFENFVKGNSNA